MAAMSAKIVCLCGSTRFHAAFDAAMLAETVQGNIVLTIGTHLASDEALFADLPEEEQLELSDDFERLHRSKIEMADEILVINVDGHVGESTRSEIAYAQSLFKPIRYWEAEGPA